MGMEQLEVQEEADGPPPGWHIISPRNNMGNELLDDDDDDDEGPPPGWSSTPSLKQPTGHENHELKEESHPPASDSMPLPGLEIGDDRQEDEGPPPGWQSMPPEQQNIKIVKHEIEAGMIHSVPSPQPIISSEPEGVEKKEVGNHYETDSSDALQPEEVRNSIDPLQPKVEYRQEQEDTKEGAQPGLNTIPVPQPQVTSLMIRPLQLPASGIWKEKSFGVASSHFQEL